MRRSGPTRAIALHHSPFLHLSTAKLKRPTLFYTISTAKHLIFLTSLCADTQHFDHFVFDFTTR